MAWGWGKVEPGLRKLSPAHCHALFVIQDDRMKEYFVYMLRCADGSYYVGVTNNVHRRVEEHISGIEPRCYTYTRRPVALVYFMAFKYIRDAINFETMIKKWSKAKKEALIRGDRHSLLLASRKKFPKRYARWCKDSIRQKRCLVRLHLCHKLLEIQ